MSIKKIISSTTTKMKFNQSQTSRIIVRITALLLLFISFSCKEKKISNDYTFSVPIDSAQVVSANHTAPTDSILTLTGRYFGAGLSSNVATALGGVKFQLITPEGDVYFIKYKPNPLLTNYWYHCVEVKARISPIPKGAPHKGIKLIDVLETKTLDVSCIDIPEKNKVAPKFITRIGLDSINNLREGKDSKPFIAINATIKKVYRPASDIDNDYQILKSTNNLYDQFPKGVNKSQPIYIASDFYSSYFNDMAYYGKNKMLVGRLERGYSENFHFKVIAIINEQTLTDTDIFSNLYVDQPSDYKVYLSLIPENDIEAFHEIPNTRGQISRKLFNLKSYWDSTKDNVMARDLIHNHFVETLPFVSYDTKRRSTTLHFNNGGSKKLTPLSNDEDKYDSYRIVNYSAKTNYIHIEHSLYEDDPVQYLINMSNGSSLSVKDNMYTNSDFTEVVIDNVSVWEENYTPEIKYYKYFNKGYHLAWTHKVINKQDLSNFKWDEQGTVYAEVNHQYPVKLEMYQKIAPAKRLGKGIALHNWFPKKNNFPDFAKQLYINAADQESLPNGIFTLIGADNTGLWTLQGTNYSSATTIVECVNVNLVYSPYKRKDMIFPLKNTDARNDKDVYAIIKSELLRLEREGIIPFETLSECKATIEGSKVTISSLIYGKGKSFTIDQNNTYKDKPGCWVSYQWNTALEINNPQTFYYLQTGCADPWDTDPNRKGDSTQSRIANYLLSKGIQITDFSLEFDETIRETCKACGCKTGNQITIKASKENEEALLKIGFTKNKN